MRLPSGVSDQYIYFVAVDSTDLKTRKTGLSGFTVYRSRNGGVATLWTTPTINETDSTNMPGVYELLVDEDVTLDAGDQSQEYCLHITVATMAPVTRVIELYRSSVTAGETLTVASGNVGTVNTLTTYTGNTVQTGDSYARLGLPAGASVSADILALDNFVDDLESRIGTPSNLGSGATISANLVDIEGQTDDIGVAGAGLTNIGTIATVTTLTNLPAITANWLTAAGINADALTAAKFADDVSTEFANKVWDTDATGRQTQGTFGQAIGDPAADTNTIFKAVVTDATGATVGIDVVAVKAETASIQSDTNDLQTQVGTAGAGLTNINLPDQTMNITGDITGSLSGSVGSVTAGVTVTTNNDRTGYSLTAVTGLGNQTADITGNLSGSVGSVTGAVGSVTGAVGSVTGLTAADVGAIKTKTDSLAFTVAGQVDANIQSVNDVTVTGDGQPGTEWGP